MLIRVRRDNSYFIMLSLMWVIVYLMPDFFRQNDGVNSIIRMFKAGILLILIVYTLKHNLLSNIYGILILLILISIMFTALLNNQVANDTIKMAARILSYFLLFLIILSSDISVIISSLSCVLFFVNIICLINTLQIIYHRNTNDIDIFFLGSDNGSAYHYFFSLFLAHILYLLVDKKKIGLLISYLNILIYAIIQEVGAVKLCLIVHFLLLSIMLLWRNREMQLVRLKWLLLFYYFVNILLFLSQYTSFRDVINAVFYNKYNSITSRNELWIYFITKSLHRPFFGYGASSGAYRNLPENYYKWIMQGNTHNSNIEIIYHYGYVLFVLFSILLFLVAKNKKTSKQVTIYSEYALFIWLMHGLVENGFSYIFLYIPFVIYGEKLDNNLSKEKRFIIISRDFG